MGAISKTFSSVWEALPDKRKNALFTLSCRALAEPYNFYRIDGELLAGIFAGDDSLEAKIVLECQKQFRQKGRYSPQTISAALPGIGGVDGDYLWRTTRDAEIDLVLAFDFFSEIHGQYVEHQIAVETIGWLNENKTSQEIQVLAEQARRQRGAIARSTGSDGVSEFEAELLAALENKTFDFPVKPHLSKLRGLIPHYEPGDYIVVGALTGIGKTYFGLNTVYHNARNGIPCCCINLENTPKNIMKRVWQMHGQHRFSRDLRGSDDILQKHLTTWDDVKKMPLRSHNPGRSLPAILSTIRRDWNERGIQFALVDYAQLITVPEYRGNRNYELGEVSAAFRGLSLELQIPIMVLAQFKQEVSKYADKRGGLYDFKDCANFAQDATYAISLYRPFEVGVEFDETGSQYGQDYADVTVVKGRETGKAQAKCLFDPVLGFHEGDFAPAPPTNAPYDYTLPKSATENRDFDIPF